MARSKRFKGYTLPATGYQLDSINKSLFHPVEDHHPKEHHHDHENSAVPQPCPGGVTGAEETRPEGLDDGGDGVEQS